MLQSIISSQFDATLTMLEQTLTRCPDRLWSAGAGENRFWHVAYHALFYTHLYLQPMAEEFTPWAKHKEGIQYLGPTPWPPHTPPPVDEPYSKDDLLAYLAFCRREAGEQTAHLDPTAPSGFDWLPMDKTELQFYSIRHLQHHVGELSTLLLVHAGIEIDWVGMGARGQSDRGA